MSEARTLNDAAQALQRKLDGYEWRYVCFGKATHAVKIRGGLVDCVSRCGVDPGSSLYWYGTGSQEEYEHAITLPKCRRCVALIRKYG